MTTDQDLLAQTADALLTRHCDAAVREAAEESGWAAALWDRLDEAGFTRLGVPEAAGGSGGDCADALTLLQAAGRHAVPLPLAESSVLGGWLLAAAGLSVPAGPLSVPVPHPGDTLEVSGGRVSGQLSRVPWGGRAAAVAALAQSPDGTLVVALDPGQATVTPARNLAGDPRDRLVFDGAALAGDRVAAAPPGTAERLALRGALSRTALLAGACARAASLTVGYAHQRQQFGRPIARFQAVGSRLVQLASEAELAVLSATVAGLQFTARDLDAAFEVGAARVTAARAAGQAGPHAHQVHGAIGMTREYELHHVTRRLLAWQQEWGGAAHWGTRIGERVLRDGADALWPMVSAGIAAPAAEVTA
ncbi:MAG TPA: acyl-CoA dehydrogenase family protein [Streptosporangiaceae bacterium]|nr:acyl-CoA dehydrogenase family protein [Streptosporangiaceae bacterium]